MTKFVRLLRSGQVTIPIEMREKLAIGQDTLLQLQLREGEILLRPVRIEGSKSGSSWLNELYDLFADSRKAAKKHSSREIEKDIAQAIKAVRKK